MADENHREDSVKAAFEKAKGTLKEAAGGVLGNPALAAEGQAEREFAEEQTQSDPKSGRAGDG